MSANRAELGQSEKVPLGANNFPAIPLLAQAEVLYERQGDLYECYIPVELIDHEEVPVQEEWAESLARQMRQKADNRGGSGQQTPIRLGWIEGEAKFRIIDGFHRDAALMKNGEDTIYATVESTDWDTLYDDRIFAAKDNAHVRFSRVVKWIQEVWEHSGLSDEMTVERAILLYRFDTDGSKLGIDSQVVQSAKDWIIRKEQQWDIAAMTIHSYLQTADSVDPLLVNSTRDKKSGKALFAPTQQIIKIFSNNLPNEFALQHVVWEQAKTYNLKGPQVKALCSLVRGKDAAEAQSILSEADIANIKPAYGRTKEQILRRAADPRHKGATALKAARLEILQVEQRVQQSLDRNEEVDSDMIQNLNETVREARALQTQLGSLATKLTALKARNQSAENAGTDTSLNRQITERAYTKHQDETARNQGRKPEPRLRASQLAIELPTFGKFSHEDWGSLEPHYRLALSLDHPGIQEETFNSTIALLSAAFKLSVLPEETEKYDNSPLEIAAEAQRLTKFLTSSSPREVGPIVMREKASNRVKLTPTGRSYLKEVATNTLLAVDDSH
jgi:hypothetical protein